MTHDHDHEREHHDAPDYASEIGGLRHERRGAAAALVIDPVTTAENRFPVRIEAGERLPPS
jgi:hypothetical protein